MQNVVINKVIVPTVEVVSNPSVRVTAESNWWQILEAIATAVIALQVLAGLFLWIKEHYWINRWHRYDKLEPALTTSEIEKDKEGIQNKFADKDIFEHRTINRTGSGSIYCFQIRNLGTTHDYIYKAEIDNNIGKKINVSTRHILTGSEFVFENLPHILYPLQGEVWYIGVENEAFVGVRNPKFIIYSGSVGKIEFNLDERMFVKSIE